MSNAFTDPLLEGLIVSNDEFLAEYEYEKAAATSSKMNANDSPIQGDIDASPIDSESDTEDNRIDSPPPRSQSPPQRRFERPYRNARSRPPPPFLRNRFSIPPNMMPPFYPYRDRMYRPMMIPYYPHMRYYPPLRPVRPLRCGPPAFRPQLSRPQTPIRPQNSTRPKFVDIAQIVEKQPSSDSMMISPSADGSSPCSSHGRQNETSTTPVDVAVSEVPIENNTLVCEEETTTTSTREQPVPIENNTKKVASPPATELSPKKNSTSNHLLISTKIKDEPDDDIIIVGITPPPNLVIQLPQISLIQSNTTKESQVICQIPETAISNANAPALVDEEYVLRYQEAEKRRQALKRKLGDVMSKSFRMEIRSAPPAAASSSQQENLVSTKVLVKCLPTGSGKDDIELVLKYLGYGNVIKTTPSQSKVVVEFPDEESSKYFLNLVNRKEIRCRKVKCEFYHS